MTNPTTLEFLAAMGALQAIQAQEDAADGLFDPLPPKRVRRKAKATPARNSAAVRKQCVRREKSKETRRPRGWALTEKSDCV